MAYEVLTYTLADGWVNCWTTYEADGSAYPTVYDTYEEAESDLLDLLEEWPDYSRDEYMIRELVQ